MDHRHQNQGGGSKRRREDEGPGPGSNYSVLSKLIKIGDDAYPTLQVDQEQITSLTKYIKRQARESVPGSVVGMVVDCFVQLPTKLPVYALIVGLLNAEEPDLAAEIVTEIGNRLTANLQIEGNPRTARILLSGAAALVVTGVVEAASVLAVMQSLVDAAVALADNSKQGSTYWQSYGDYLVYTALAAIPFGSSELMASASEPVKKLMETVDTYLSKRPIAVRQSLSPFFGSAMEDDTLAEGDAGAATYLTRMVEAVGAYVNGSEHALKSIPRVHIDQEVELAGAERTHQLAAVALPATIPVTIPEGATDIAIAAIVLKSFPPRGIMSILDKQHTEGDRPLIERFVAEDYILDTIAWWDADRTECAKRLARSMPLSFQYEPLMCEVLFSQMLRVPSPEFKPIMYGTLMVDLCKLLTLFPRAMSGCVRECFARMNVLDPVLRIRLAEWLAYHLSNFEYVWPWSRWSNVLEAPVYDSQRRFCISIMNRLIRLCYWERVESVLPEEFRILLPAKPEVCGLPAADDPSVAEDLESQWAARALDQVRQKASAEDLDRWIEEFELEEKLGGNLGVLKMLARCLLVAGAKSYTHMATAFDRYYGPLNEVASKCGEAAGMALIETAISVWHKHPQRACMAVDRLTTLRLVSPATIVQWAFESGTFMMVNDESQASMSSEIMHRAIDRTIARVQDAQEDLAAIESAMAEDSNEEAAEAKAEKTAYAEECLSQRRAAFIQAIRSFFAAIADAKSKSENEADEGAQQLAVAMKADLLLNLKSFVRQYLGELTTINDGLEELVSAADPEAKAAMDEYLYSFA